MKTDKEYPATHSMSTAWYIVDEDGNVGIMDFDDNGPVPFDVPSDAVIDELVFGDYENEVFSKIDLTDEQIDELIKNPHSPTEEEYWIEPIIQIDLNKEKDFFELVDNKDFKIKICVSKKKRNIYS